VETETYSPVRKKTPEVKFTAPGAHILAVDDIETNLTVLKGLLAPLRMNITLCSSGAEAVELIQQQHFDFVLMDHMMPGMDGLEAAALIRTLEGDYYQKLPIIALTANAVSGMREMFLEKGFNDYLTKPIEIAKLDELMAKWIPKEKQIKAGAEINRETFSGESGITIPGVDAKRGIKMTGGTEAGYRKVLVQFRKDAEERLHLLEIFLGASRQGVEQNLAAFTTQVHALKSASATIGAAGLSARAAELEAEGKAENMTAIREKLPEFVKQLAELVEGINAVLSANNSAAGNGKKADTEAEFTASLPLLRELETALKKQKAVVIDRLLDELDQKNTDAKMREILDQMSDYVLLSEYEKAGETLLLLMKKQENTDD
jgi:CheY-like chemotaxis protein